MKLYQITTQPPMFAGTGKEARGLALTFGAEVREVDVPTRKEALIVWLNQYGETFCNDERYVKKLDLTPAEAPRAPPVAPDVEHVDVCETLLASRGAELACYIEAGLSRLGEPGMQQAAMILSAYPKAPVFLTGARLAYGAIVETYPENITKPQAPVPVFEKTAVELPAVDPFS